MDKKRFKKTLLLAVKIAVGSSFAIYLASLLHLEYAASAGSITLLTLFATKWETVRLSLARLVTFAVAVVIGGVTFVHLNSEWLAYGVFIFLIVMICETLGWKATISVNAVIGTHFLYTRDFGMKFIFNEFVLVCLGITIALILNLFYDYRAQKTHIISNMRYTEQQLQMILGEMAAYLSNKEMQRNVWENICELENKLRAFTADAYEYQDNTFHSHPGYYIDYFEMRMRQVHILHSLHYELKKIRTVPKQARVIAEYILYLTDYVIEINVPTQQMERLKQIFEDMKEEPLPETREEFENRAMLFHVLMDLEEFLKAKKHFAEMLDEERLRRYWNKDHG